MESLQELILKRCPIGKRSNFERIARDFYSSPYESILPLLPHLAPRTRYVEPCVGDYALVRHLRRHGHELYFGSDIEDRSREVDGVTERGIIIDAMSLTTPLKQADCIITNTPWRREILHPMIEHFRNYNTAWLLLDADWAFTKQSSNYMKYCSMFVAVGRLRWIEGSKTSGKDNAAWYRLEQEPCETIFIGR